MTNSTTPAAPPEQFLVFELDLASGRRYVRGKDGRLYRQSDVAEADERASRGDPVARAAIARVDFSVDDDGAPRPEDEAFAAMTANDAAWERGEFDHLTEVAELWPSSGRGRRLTWAQQRRDRRERAAQARRDRHVNLSLRPVARPTDELALAGFMAAQPGPGVIRATGAAFQAALTAATTPRAGLPDAPWPDPRRA